ncbi:hypothetical protein [Polaribacter sp. L3A8]|uniref:hypothetical protein n=1 Tax=Polaribacter sp. L3A8 TaxID=2686361 RepID=UPI0020C7CF8E|nr:hypothetical protein [Polaribacter sp. L3A8]
MTWAFRDRFFMDAGHLSTLMYAQYYLLGNYKKEDVANFRQWGSITPGHPEVDVARGIENTSGPLGRAYYGSWCSNCGKILKLVLETGWIIKYMVLFLMVECKKKYLKEQEELQVI